MLALHGEDYATTCSEGVTYVNWEAYASGHPKTFASVGAFAREREKRPRVELLSCGGRLDPAHRVEVFEALETTTCADAGDFENDVVRRARLDPEEETPRFGKCLFCAQVHRRAQVATSRASGGTPSGRDARLHEKRSRYYIFIVD